MCLDVGKPLFLTRCNQCCHVGRRNIQNVVSTLLLFARIKFLQEAKILQGHDNVVLAHPRPLLYLYPLTLELFFLLHWMSQKEGTLDGQMRVGMLDALHHGGTPIGSITQHPQVGKGFFRRPRLVLLSR